MFEDCRHYIMQTTASEEKLERCRMGANEQLPFRLPGGVPVLRTAEGVGRRVDHPDAGRALIRRGPEVSPPESRPR